MIFQFPFEVGDCGRQLEIVINPVPNLLPPADNIHTSAHEPMMFSCNEVFIPSVVWVLGAGDGNQTA